MTVRNLQTLTDYATWTAAIAGLPAPLDASYVLEDQDSATYDETINLSGVNTNGHTLTLRGREGAARPTVTRASVGNALNLGSAARVTVRQMRFVSSANAACVQGANTGTGIRFERCEIFALADYSALSINTLVGLYIGNCVLVSQSTTNNTLFTNLGANITLEHSLLLNTAAGAASLVNLNQLQAGGAIARSNVYRFADGAATRAIYQFDTTTSAGRLTSDGNVFSQIGDPPSTPAIALVGATLYGTIAAWTAAHGEDAASALSNGVLPHPTLFADEAGGDYHSTFASVAVDGSAAELLLEDLDGVVRPQGSASDIGPYEFVDEPPFVDSEVPSPDTSGVAGDAEVSFEVHDIDSGVDLTTVTVTITPQGGAVELAYDGGAGGFQAGFSGSVTAIADGYTIVVARAAAWPSLGQHEVEVYAEDNGGNTVTHAWAFRTAAPAVASWCARGTDWLLAQFRDLPHFEQLLCAALDEATELEQVLADLVSFASIELAFGVLLDRVGRGLGFDREPGLADDEYRAALRAVAAANVSDGTPDSLIAILELLLDPSNGSALTEAYAAGFFLEIDDPVTYALGRRAARILRRAKPAGVSFDLRYEPTGFTVLAFDDDPVRPVVAIPEVGAATTVRLAEADAGV